MNELVIPVFFLAITIPNYLRQVAYRIAYSETRDEGFIDSFETRWMFRQNKTYLGYIEETVFGIFFSYFWFFVPVLKFMVLSWIVDATQDVLIAIRWLDVRKNPYRVIENPALREFAREILVPYITIGVAYWGFFCRA